MIRGHLQSSISTVKPF